MSFVVLKFGGTSLADLPCIERAANTLIEEHQKGKKVVAVVSAMAGTTNQLVSWVQDARGNGPHSLQNSSEYDVVVSSGEQITAGLLALSLQKKGFLSRSWTGSQIPIITTSDFSNATITHIHTAPLLDFASQGGISIVTGFQGVTDQGRITTLGRGGSDTTAVTLACSLHAERCDIYTDVEGVYTADPRLVEEAEKIETLDYKEMLALAEQGAKVLHPQAVAKAQEHKLPVRVLSSFTFKPGTLISLESRREKPLFGLTYTLGWTLLESDTPLNLTPVPYTTELFYTASGTKKYRTVYHSRLLSLSEPSFQDDLTASYSVVNNLASISFIIGTFDKHHMRYLRARFLSALSDHIQSFIQLRATHPFQWQVWVQESHLPSTLRFLHQKLRAS